MSFHDALIAAGFIVDRPIIDGATSFTRLPLACDRKGRAGWALLFAGGDAGIYGNWKTNESTLWRADGLTQDQLSEEQKLRQDERRKHAERLILAEYEANAEKNRIAWENRPVTTELTPYLKAKKVGSYGLRGDLCPARDFSGKLWNYQDIAATPKLFRLGKVKGCFHRIDGNKEKIVICSGYATGASIHEATGLEVIVSFGDGNMFEVAKIFKDAGVQNILVAADNDSDKPTQSGNKAAEKIRDTLGLKVVMPDAPGDFNDHAVAGKNIYHYFLKTVPAFTLGEYLADKSEMPDDLIAPRVLTPGGMLVFGGAPKVGKSDFILAWLAHMAAGAPFMGMRPARPMRVFYLQAEIGYHYLRERANNLGIDHHLLEVAGKNLVITPQIRMLLDAEGVSAIGHAIRQMGGADIVAIDPLANVFDGKDESHNSDMMNFLQQRVEALRPYTGTDCGFILAHHTKKVAKDELALDPFLAFRGASSLRGYYTTGMLMYRPDEDKSERVLVYELRNGHPIDKIHLDKSRNRWIEVPQSGAGDFAAPSKSDYKEQYILDTLKTEIDAGRNYTRNKAAKFFEGKNGLGSQRAILMIFDDMIVRKLLFVTGNGDLFPHP